jgi:hypothetical protein
MDVLFDMTPDGDPVQARKKPRKRTAAVAVEAEASRSDALDAILARPGFIVGRLDGHIACHRCLGCAHDIIEDYGPEWQVECCFCGLREDIPSIDGYLKPKSDFLFRDGRYAGQSIDQAYATPRGREYVQWAAKEHKREAVREACANVLLTQSQPVV